MNPYQTPKEEDNESNLEDSDFILIDFIVTIIVLAVIGGFGFFLGYISSKIH